MVDINALVARAKRQRSKKSKGDEVERRLVDLKPATREKLNDIANQMRQKLGHFVYPMHVARWIIEEALK